MQMQPYILRKGHGHGSSRVALKWIVQHERLLTFQSSSAAHQEADAAIFDFQLTEPEMKALDGLHGASIYVCCLVLGAKAPPEDSFPFKGRVALFAGFLSLGFGGRCFRPEVCTSFCCALHLSFLHLDLTADGSNKKLVTLHYVVEILARLPTVFLYSEYPGAATHQPGAYFPKRKTQLPEANLAFSLVSVPMFMVNFVLFDPCFPFYHVNQVYYYIKYLEALFMWTCILEAKAGNDFFFPRLRRDGGWRRFWKQSMEQMDWKDSWLHWLGLSITGYQSDGTSWTADGTCCDHEHHVLFVRAYAAPCKIAVAVAQDRRCLTPAPALTEQRARMSAVEEEDMDLEAQIPLVSEPAQTPRGGHPMQHISGLENIIEDLRQISKASCPAQRSLLTLMVVKQLWLQGLPWRGTYDDGHGGQVTIHVKADTALLQLFIRLLFWLRACTRKNATGGGVPASAGNFRHAMTAGYLSKHARIRTFHLHSSADGQTIAAWPRPARHPNTAAMAAHTSRIAAKARFPGQWQAALALLCSMPQHALQPNVFSFTAAISAMAKCTRWQLAEGLFELMQDSLVSRNVVSFNATLNAYARAGKWDSAQKALESMPCARVCPDAISISTAISACKRAGNWKAAVGFLAASTALRAPVTTVTCNALLSVCESASQWQIAMALVKNIGRESLQTDEITHNTAISACGQGGQWPQAVALFAAALALKQTSAATFNACMHALQQNSQWQRAMTLFGRMACARITPDAASFATSISCCHHSAEWQLAMHLLKQMSSASVVRNSVVCNAALTTCEKAGERKMAFSLLRAFPRHGVVADEISYNATISACAKTDRWDMALQVLEEMLMASIRPSEVSITAALAAFEISGEWEQALQMMDFLLKLAPLPSLACFNALLGSFSRALQWERSLKLLVDVGGDDITYQTSLAACSSGSKWQLSLCLLRGMQDMQLMGESLSVAKDLTVVVRVCGCGLRSVDAEAQGTSGACGCSERRMALACGTVCTLYAAEKKTWSCLFLYSSWSEIVEDFWASE
ncbi:PTAC2 [Symbiodinium sp. CCMP2592]|nr:PTAC2 [Symbiodinium sp. CCMP2592]